VKKGDLVIVFMEDWPHDIIFGLYRVQVGVDILKARYASYCALESKNETRWTWTEKMVEEGLLERLPAAHLCLGASWYPPNWEVLCEADEGVNMKDGKKSI
jgi:hypothetical protein